MDYKLIALDLDETTLRSDKSITDTNKAAVKKALDKGIKVVLCSGRTFGGMIDVANELGITGSNQYMITNGGDLIQDLEGKIIFKKILTAEDCEITTSFLNQNKIKFVLIDTDNNTYPSYQEWQKKQTDIVKVLMHIKKDDMEKISTLIHEKFDKDYFVVKTGAEYLEIFPQDISKGKTVERLAKHLNIDLKQVMAMGDMNNDISMIKIAGMGVAMGNAAKDVKDISNYVTADNNHSGVGLAIEKFAL